MEPLAFVHSLQFLDSLFPVGAFAYSDGLETAASTGLVHNAASLADWMNHFLDGVFVPCEGLALVKCMQALEDRDLDALYLLDEELTAIRPASAVRKSSSGVGKRLLSIYATLAGDNRFSETVRSLPYGNAAAAYAVVFFRSSLSKQEGLLAYGYGRLAGIASAGLRLISIGQQQAQELLTQTINRLPGIANQILAMTDQPLRSFSPQLDMQQMNHQYVYSRLFRS